MKYKLYICAIILLSITLFIAFDTYALFETNSNGTLDFDIAKWVIKLNDRDITLDKIVTLDDFTYINSSHTEDGYFAPGSKAEYEINIDTSETDVKVLYDIIIDDSELEAYPNIISKIVDVDTNKELVSNEISGLIDLNDSNAIKRIKIVLDWQNISDYDESDTSLIDGNLRISIRANFKQYIE